MAETVVGATDVLDSGRAIRERARAAAQNADASEQRLITTQREQLKVVATAEKELLAAYAEFETELAAFVQRVETLAVVRRAYDRAWSGARTLNIDPLPHRTESLPIQAQADTDDGYALRSLLSRYRVALATPLP
jgi:hypothetical protein